MDQYRKLAELLRGFSPKIEDTFIFADVTEITGDTCSAKIGDFEVTGIRMKATNNGAEDKLVLIPKVGSKVLLGSNNGDLRALFVAKVDDPQKINYKHGDLTVEIDGESGKITINGGDNGGLTITPELRDQLDKMTKRVDTALKLLEDNSKIALHPNPTWTAYYQLLTTPLQKEDFSNIEDEKVTH